MADHMQKSEIAKREEEILEFWNKNKIFQKSLEKDSPQGEFVFYDGPPFATGLPHYGHISPGTMKDVIPRFKTMQGYHVPRRWGWDTHGLPIENIVEKELGLKSKKDIDNLGIEKFNETARSLVLRYDQAWKEIIPRTGRWVDMDNAYVSMDPTYSESIWWSFKTLHEKNLIYQGFKSMMLCPHCGTTLSNFEVAQGYKDITDISVYAKFELVDEPGTFVLAWTTTPWTLPGNVALAINPDIEYAKIEVGEEKYILAKERLLVLKDKEFKILEEFKGESLVGKKYKPVFDYYIHADLKNKERAWKIVPADFVTTTDGTGVVHIAPAFGEDDYQLALKENLPFIQHVGVDGKFKDEVKDFAGMSVKPKSDDEKERLSADIVVIKYLQDHGTFFAKEKITHSYPHCWRCDTPLLNYASSSWFVKVTDIKNDLVSENRKVTWVPPEVGEGRFGKWLENARDWAISRSRYWGAPLPVWIHEKTKEVVVFGSIAELKKKTKRNTYFVIRHGDADSNTLNTVSGKPTTPHHLTEKGKKDIEKVAKKLKGQADLIFSSDFVRTKETAEIIAKTIGISEREVVYDKRLREYNFGEYEGKHIDTWHEYFKSRVPGDTETQVPGGESPQDVRNRIAEFLYETDEKHKGKTIIIVSHQDPIWHMGVVAEGKNLSQELQSNDPGIWLENGQIQELDFAFIPHNKKYEVDFHRPYIDEVTFAGFKRIPEVFDTWYESGSMPYAHIHYPFQNKKLIDKKEFFPADFIAESQDQTRGWFYSLLVLSVGLFGKSPYKNVICGGIVLAEDGQKMSKRLQNYPELTEVLDKYGADALRYYLMSSPVVHAEDLAFSEKGLDEVVKKVIMRLGNVYTFFATYVLEYKGKGTADKNILDQWIMARLGELTDEVTRGLEQYELDRASRPFAQFIDDLSTWYLRRSRERFKGDNEEDKQNALYTTRHILLELAKLLAPFMPFLAEDIYRKVGGKKESVHLENWPQVKKVDKKIIEEMAEVRKIVSLALEARAKVNQKIRQPLRELKIKNEKLKDQPELLELIKDEVNIKEVSFDKNLKTEVELDTVISEELKQEGQAREFIRGVQELRKQTKLQVSDMVTLTVQTNDQGRKLIEKFKSDIAKTAQLKSIEYKNTDGEKISVDDLEFIVKIAK